MDVVHDDGDTPDGDELAPSKRSSTAGSSQGSPSAGEDPHEQLLSGQSYNRVTAGGSSRLHAGNVYNNYYQAEPPGPTTRFSSTHDEGDTLETLLRCLSFEQMETRLASIATAHPDTCAWLLDCPQYERWRDPSLQAEHHGCLWIKGKPGAGKSTIMKNLMRHIEAAEVGDKIISFFFNARGATLERTTEGLYRSLLYQMADDMLSPLTDLRAETIELYRTQGWPLELLKELCRKALRQLASENKVTIFIDALDEGNVEDDIRDMVTFVEGLATEAYASGRSLHICLASRHHPTISIALSELLILDTLENHDNDITTFAQAQLRVRNPVLRAQLVSAISARASGIFLWVAPVVKILNKEADRGNQHRLEVKLQELPNGLHALFEAILEKDPDQDHHLLPTLIWVLFALGSLTLVEMYFAIMISTDQLRSGNIVWDPDVINQTVLVNFVLTSSRGLLEIVEPGTRFRRTGCNRVQIIHESVREYLLQHGLQKIDEDLGQSTKAICYGRLAKWCAKYVQSAVQLGLFGKGEQAISMRKCPLLEYATQHCLTYAEQAAEQGCRQSIYAEAPIETWRLIADIRNPRPDVEFPPSNVYHVDWKAVPTICMPASTTMLHLFIQQGLPCLANIELEQNAKRDSKERQMYLDTVCLCTDEYNSKSSNSGCSALGIAVSMVEVHITRALLHQGADVSVSCGRHGSPWNLALCRVRDRVIQERDEFGECDDNTDSNFVRGEFEIAHLLLRNGAANSVDEPLEIPLPLLEAIETKDWNMVQIQMGEAASEKTFNERRLDNLLSGWQSKVVAPPRDHVADPTVYSRIYHTLWGSSIRRNLPC